MHAHAHTHIQTYIQRHRRTHTHSCRPLAHPSARRCLSLSHIYSKEGCYSDQRLSRFSLKVLDRISWASIRTGSVSLCILRAHRRECVWSNFPVTHQTPLILERISWVSIRTGSVSRCVLRAHRRECAWSNFPDTRQKPSNRTLTLTRPFQIPVPPASPSPPLDRMSRRDQFLSVCVLKAC